MTEVRKNTPMLGKCYLCHHVWPIAYLPLPIDIAANLMNKAACPHGCKHIVTIPMDDDVDEFRRSNPNMLMKNKRIVRDEDKR